MINDRSVARRLQSLKVIQQSSLSIESTMNNHSKLIASLGCLTAITVVLSARDVGAESPPKSGVPRQSAGARPAKWVDSSLKEAIAFGQDSREALAEVQDYTARFSKTEQVGTKTVEQSMDMKFRRKPFSVYLRNRDGKESGREVLYCEGAHDGKLLVKEKGLLASLAGTVSLRPDDKQVMDENRYPITDVGIHRILEKSHAIWEADLKNRPDDVEVKRLEQGEAAGVACEGFQFSYRTRRGDDEYSGSRVYFDRKTRLPVLAEQYGWPKQGQDKAPLLERYVYEQIQPNVGLTDADFDPKNPSYAFGGR